MAAARLLARFYLQPTNLARNEAVGNLTKRSFLMHLSLSLSDTAPAPTIQAERLAVWFCDVASYHDEKYTHEHPATDAECDLYEREHKANGYCSECLAFAQFILQDFAIAERRA